MADADGPPVSYLSLRRGTPVYTSDGFQLGTVDRVLSVPEDDVFTGIVVSTAQGPRMAERDDITTLAERAVRLSIDRAASGKLAPPSSTPSFKVDPEAGTGRSLRNWWNRLTGRGGWKRVS